MQPPRKLSLIELICDSTAILWKEWPKDMELSQMEHGGFVLKGECPHCGNKAAFPTVTDPYHEGSGDEQRHIAVARCIACNEYILAMLKLGELTWVYDRHYPLGEPNDTLSEDIPVEIRSDFKEAIRAEWIKAYKATVLMCRRSLQTSCDMEKAVGKDLYTQIDDLAAKQKITAPLKGMAHRIRLLGKKGAHGDYSDIDDTITPKDAADAIQFMKHYLEHVYVFPARLAASSVPSTGKKRPP
jgi:hypothetical protein